MTTDKERIQAAKSQLRNKCQQILQQMNRSLLRVYDTGIGGAAEHSYACNQRAIQNGKTERQYWVRHRQYEAVLEHLNNCENSTDVWNSLWKNCLPLRSEHQDPETGSVNWQAVRDSDDQNFFMDEINAWSMVYRCFWK